MDVMARARMILEDTARAPKMYANSREAFLAHVCGVVIVVNSGFSPWEFYREHADVFSLGEHVDDDWAKNVVSDALQHVFVAKK